MQRPRFSLVGDSRSNFLAVAALCPSWIAGVIARANGDGKAWAFAFFFALLAGIATRLVPSVLQWPRESADVRRQVARDATRLAFWLGILTVVVLIIVLATFPCDNGSDCN